jgi:hypothetical protein
VEYKGSTPMPDISLVDDYKWRSVPISCLNEVIQKTLKDIWKEEGKFVMLRSELTCVTLCLNRGVKSVLLYFE